MGSWTPHCSRPACGIGLREFTSNPPYIEKRFSDTHGFLRLTLHPDGSFDWNFVPTSGTGTDYGTRAAG